MPDFPVVPQNVQLNTDAPAQNASAFFNAFNQQFKQARLASAMQRVQSGDVDAWNELYSLDPQLAMKLQDDHRQRVAIEQANAYYAKQHPEAAEFLAAGGQAKDIAALDYKGAQTNAAETRAQDGQLKTQFKAWDKAYNVLGSIKPGDPVSGNAAIEQAREWMGIAGIDISGLDTLQQETGGALTIEQIKQLGNYAVSEKDRLAAQARDRGLDISQGRLDESIRSHKENERLGGERIEQSNTNNIRSTSTSAANNIRSTTTSSDNNIRSTNTSRENSIRSAESERSGRRRKDTKGGNKGAYPEGTRARKNGKIYVMHNGQWVPE